MSALDRGSVNQRRLPLKDNADRYPVVILSSRPEKRRGVVSLDHSQVNSLIETNIDTSTERHGERSRVIDGKHVTRSPNVRSKASEEGSSEQGMSEWLDTAAVASL